MSRHFVSVVSELPQDATIALSQQLIRPLKSSYGQEASFGVNKTPPAPGKVHVTQCFSFAQLREASRFRDAALEVGKSYANQGTVSAVHVKKSQASRALPQALNKQARVLAR